MAPPTNNLQGLEDIERMSVSERIVPMEIVATEELADFNSRYNVIQKVNLGKILIPPQATFQVDVAETTIRHVDPAKTLLDRHLELFNRARERLEDTTNRDGTAARLLEFIEKWQDDEDVQDLLGDAIEGGLAGGTGTGTGTGTAVGLNLKKKPFLQVQDAELFWDPRDGEPPTPVETGADRPGDNDASLLFKLSRFAMDDFHALSGRRNALERLKRRKTVLLRESVRRSARLEREIAAARSEYASLDKTRIAAEEDYTLVRGLMEEQLQAVDDAYVERRRLLSSPVALCYVRVNDLPVGIDHRATPLIPRVDPGQMPVACDTAGELPERLSPFLELLADQPMSAWRSLADRWHLLPPAWVYQPPQPVLPGYHAAIQALPTAFRGLSKAVPVPMVQRMSAWPAAGASSRRSSQAALGRQAAERITLEQLTKVRSAALRIAARRLQDDLPRALSCLLDQLLALPAADRFAWSRLAEDDHLAVERPQRWPGFDAHRRSTAGLQLRMIVEWLFAQLADDAPSEARTALRTTLRACLLHTVNDDPAELLQGDVVQFPGQWKPGVLIGATLNRVPMLKAALKVYDAERRLIGEARVVDSEPPSQPVAMLAAQVQAQVEIVSTYVATPASFVGWTVVG